MENTKLSLVGVYVVFLAALLAASVLLIISINYQLLPFSTSLSTYVVFIILLISIMLWQIRQMVNATIQRMDNMLDHALINPASALIYDESKLSVLENKLYRLLTTSAASASSIVQEKNLIKTLVSDISHQTKTPIANILLYAQLLQEQENIADQSQQLIDQITAQSEKLSFLIQALVKTSRLETGIINVNPRLSPVPELLNNCIKAIRSQAEEKSLTLCLSCADDIQARFDSKWTEEALINILDNAVKYTPTGGSVSLSAIPYELFTRIDIADTGIGMEDKEINHIFKRFYRSPSLSQYEGVGIGLYLAREILNAEGGYIKVKSEPYKGSIFSVFLPNAQG